MYVCTRLFITVNIAVTLQITQTLKLDTWLNIHMITILIMLNQINIQQTVFVCALDQELVSYWYTHLAVLLVGAASPKKPKTPPFQIGSGWNLAGLFMTFNTHWLMELDFWFDVTLLRWQFYTFLSCILTDEQLRMHVQMSIHVFVWATDLCE